MIMVWLAVAMLPHASVAVYVRAYTPPAHDASLVKVSAQVTVTAPPPAAKSSLNEQSSSTWKPSDQTNRSMGH